ncbi:putative tail tubular protein B [Aeromonas phage Atoyac23]|nr:putative tail tubular protein B [Aeromonas phage Atoyac23]
MAGVNGRYDSVILGVSQQTPHDRRSGQMESQDNFLSDPVRGLARRWGTLQNASQLVSSAALADPTLVTLAGKFNTKPFYCDGREYELIYAKQATPETGPLFCYDRLNRKFLNVQFGGAAGSLANKIKTSGVASLVNIGRFMLVAVNGFNPTYTQKEVMPAPNKARNGVIWIRQGAYSRTYSVDIKRPDGSVATVSHKTMSAAYEGVLDTSDIPWDKEDPGKYNKAVADRTNAYNTAVTKHIAASTEDIQPDTIAKKLRDKIATQLGIGNNVSVRGAYVHFEYGANISNVTSTDGGDSTYVRTVVDTVDDIDKLSPWHYNGKVMRISPKKQSDTDAYYVRATSKTGSSFGEVTWKECPGVEYTPTAAFCVAWADGNTLFVGSTPEELNAMSGNKADAPKFEPSVVGDAKTSPLPYFMTGKSINYLGIFQDRLLIVSGAVVFASRPGDYFNWFRSTVLAVDDADPVEMYALGSEDDIIRWDSSFDRNHILHGERNQYLLPGRTVLSPKSPSIQIMGSQQGTTGSEPKASGSYVFFTKGTSYGGSLHQIQMGASSDSSESFECSSQLDTYISGKPVQVVSVTAPYFVLLRLNNSLNEIFVYTYLDSMQGGERMYDSWSRWTWDPALGPCCGLSHFNDELVKFTFRRGLGGTYLVADQCYTHSELSTRPYLDSMLNFGSVKEQLKNWPKEITDRLMVVYETGDKAMLGAPYNRLSTDMPELLEPANAAKAVVGYQFDAICRTTNPFMRDRDGKSIINGRLTLSNLTLSTVNSGGVEGFVEFSGRRKQTVHFEGRLLTRTTNRVGRSPVVDAAVKLPVFHEVRECQVEFRALTWLPLTVAGIEWKGQFFNNLRRV